MRAHHPLLPSHQTAMVKAELCAQASQHFVDDYLRKGWLRRAYRQVETCGCPMDLWPSNLLQIHIGEVHV